MYTVEYKWNMSTECTFRAYMWQFVSKNLSDTM